jgi:hypothetical protein
MLADASVTPVVDVRRDGGDDRRMRSRRELKLPARPICFAGILLAVACTLPDAAEFASGAGDGGSPDGSPSDGGVRADAPTSEGGGLPSGCVGRATAFFCADFDEAPFDLGFQQVLTGPTRGTLNGDRTKFVSPSTSLVASLPKRGNGQPNAFLDRTLPSTVTSFRLSWWALVDDKGTQSAVDLGAGLFKEGPVYRSLQIRYRRGVTSDPTFELFEYANGAAQPVMFTKLSTTPALGRFMHFEMDVTQAASSSAVTVLVDGVVAATQSGLRLHEGQGALHLTTGIVSTDGPGDDIAVFVDDVVVEPL